MTAVFNAKFGGNVSIGTSNTVGLATAAANINQLPGVSLTSGTGAGQANGVYSIGETAITTGVTTTYTLSNASLTGPDGASLSITTMKGLYFENTGAVALSLAGSNSIISNATTVLPGQFILTAVGTNATVSATVTVAVQNASGSSGAYKLAVLGAQA